MLKELGGGVVESKGKINKVCEALKAELETINHGNKYLLPILTTYIKK